MWERAQRLAKERGRQRELAQQEEARRRTDGARQQEEQARQEEAVAARWRARAEICVCFMHLGETHRG